MQAEMQKDTTSHVDVSLEELVEVLIAISVVAKKLAAKIHENSETMKGDTKCTNITD